MYDEYKTIDYEESIVLNRGCSRSRWKSWKKASTKILSTSWRTGRSLKHVLKHKKEIKTEVKTEKFEDFEMHEQAVIDFITSKDY